MKPFFGYAFQKHSPPSPVGGSVYKNRPIDEAVGGVDDPAARWQRHAGNGTLAAARWLPCELVCQRT
jgi:hypothetical protein